MNFNHRRISRIQKSGSLGPQASEIRQRSSHNPVKICQNVVIYNPIWCTTMGMVYYILLPPIKMLMTGRWLFIALFYPHDRARIVGQLFIPNPRGDLQRKVPALWSLWVDGHLDPGDPWSAELRMVGQILTNLEIQMLLLDKSNKSWDSDAT